MAMRVQVESKKRWTGEKDAKGKVYIQRPAPVSAVLEYPGLPDLPAEDASKEEWAAFMEVLRQKIGDAAIGGWTYSALRVQIQAVMRNHMDDGGSVEGAVAEGLKYKIDAPKRVERLDAEERERREVNKAMETLRKAAKSDPALRAALAAMAATN